MGKNIDKNLIVMLAMCQKFINHAEQSVTNSLKTASKKVIQK